MRLSFDYSVLTLPDGRSTGPLPLLVLRLVGPSGRGVPVLGLVDSGADCTGLPIGYAQALGYEETDLERLRGRHIDGSLEFLCAKQPARATVPRIAGVEFAVLPHFVKEGALPVWGRPELGRFDVLIREREQTFTLIWEV